MSIAISLMSGCATNPPRVGVEYCEHARGIRFDTAAEVKATPAGVKRQVAEHNKTVVRLCGRR